MLSTRVAFHHDMSASLLGEMPLECTEGDNNRLSFLCQLLVMVVLWVGIEPTISASIGRMRLLTRGQSVYVGWF